MIGPVTTTSFVLAFRSKRHNWDFRTTDLDRIVVTVSRKKNLLTLVAKSWKGDRVLKAELHVRSAARPARSCDLPRFSSRASRGTRTPEIICGLACKGGCYRWLFFRPEIFTRSCFAMWYTVRGVLRQNKQLLWVFHPSSAGTGGFLWLGCLRPDARRVLQRPRVCRVVRGEGEVSPLHQGGQSGGGWLDEAFAAAGGG